MLACTSKDDQPQLGQERAGRGASRSRDRLALRDHLIEKRVVTLYRFHVLFVPRPINGCDNLRTPDHKGEESDTVPDVVNGLPLHCGHLKSTRAQQNNVEDSRGE